MTLTCNLCPKHCRIAPGKRGDCKIRMNIDGKLRAVTYGHPCAVHMDPIEKKPMFHFKPGSDILSIATAGCNLHCQNCQNWEISQAMPEDVNVYDLPPEQLVAKASELKAPSIAYTYTEPLVYYEYTLDSARQAKEKGIKNILVSAGYINEEPLRKLLPFIDGANFDLKSMSDDFYRKICSASLKPVLKTLVTAMEMGVIIEITNLLIPGLNDSDQDIKKLVSWVKSNLGAEVPIHFSAFYPQYKMQNIPSTPPETLKKARDLALSENISYVYTGNISLKEGEDTFCSSCKKRLIKRRRYKVTENRINKGFCPDCGVKQYGLWI